MKKVLGTIYSLITLFCLLYGIPMAIVNIGKDTKIVIIHLIIGGVGLILLLLAAIYILLQKRNNKS